MRIELNIWLRAAVLYGPGDRLLYIVTFKELAEHGFVVR